MTTVPFVALWSSERKYEGPMALGPDGIVTPEADHRGVHWIPFKNAPGVGVPLFGQVNTSRQIRCMRGPRCQVCGQQQPKDVVTWVLNGVTDPEPDGAPLITMTPPTCEQCIPVARQECPHVAQLDPLTVLHVTRYQAVGVFGDLFAPHTGGNPVGQVGVLFDSPQLAFLLGRQLIVALMEYKISYPLQNRKQPQ